MRVSTYLIVEKQVEEKGEKNGKDRNIDQAFYHSLISERC
jgi:hypothetical protein